MKKLVLTFSGLLLCVTVLSITACSSENGGSTATPAAPATSEAAAPDTESAAPAGGSGTAKTEESSSAGGSGDK